MTDLIMLKRRVARLADSNRDALVKCTTGALLSSHDFQSYNSHTHIYNTHYISCTMHPHLPLPLCFFTSSHPSPPSIPYTQVILFIHSTPLPSFPRLIPTPCTHACPHPTYATPNPKLCNTKKEKQLQTKNFQNPSISSRG